MKNASIEAWALLTVAIVGELLGTASLKYASEGRSVAWLGVAMGYGAALWLLHLVIAEIDMGVVYAIWSGVGIALIAVAGVVLFDERVSWMRASGLLAIVVGTALIQLDQPATTKDGKAERANVAP